MSEQLLSLWKESAARAVGRVASIAKIARAMGALWGILGITLILGSAIMRVLPHVFDAIDMGMTIVQWMALIIWSAWMVIAEGYRGFQKQFSPRVVARAWHLFNHGQPVDLILAPLYCIGFFHASKKRIITAWSVTAGITLAVFAIRYLSQPWRGIIDFGVVLGLLYGLVWVYIFAVRTVKGRAYLADPEVAV